MPLEHDTRPILHWVVHKNGLMVQVYLCAPSNQPSPRTKQTLSELVKEILKCFPLSTKKIFMDFFLNSHIVFPNSSKSLRTKTGPTALPRARRHESAPAARQAMPELQLMASHPSEPRICCSLQEEWLNG